MKTYIKLALLLVLLPGIAQADNPARGLMAQCNTALGGSMPPPAIKCLTYIDGWLDGISGMFTPDDKGNLQTITIEDGVTTLQVAKVFMVYMQNHPEEENKPRQVALWHAMLNSKLVTLVASGKDVGK
jgi:hypothetical protein